MLWGGTVISTVLLPRDLEEKQLDWEEVLEAFHNSQGTDISISTAGNGAP